MSGERGTSGIIGFVQQSRERRVVAADLLDDPKKWGNRLVFFNLPGATGRGVSEMLLVPPKGHGRKPSRRTPVSSYHQGLTGRLPLFKPIVGDLKLLERINSVYLD